MWGWAIPPNAEFIVRLYSHLPPFVVSTGHLSQNFECTIWKKYIGKELVQLKYFNFCI
jgi:hypothetical protein